MGTVATSSIKIQDSTESDIIPPTQTLTPDTASEHDYRSADEEEYSVCLRHKRSTYLSKNRQDLPSPPLKQECASDDKDDALDESNQQHTSLPSPTQEMDDDDNAEEKQDTDKPSIAAPEEGVKWCQRCGTLETPRWRFGPAGASTYVLDKRETKRACV